MREYRRFRFAPGWAMTDSATNTLAVAATPVQARGVDQGGEVQPRRGRRARSRGGSGDLPAHPLRRILSLSTSLVADTSTHTFSQRLAQHWSAVGCCACAG